MLLNYLLLAALLVFLFVDYKKAVIVLAVFSININFFSLTIIGTVYKFLVLVAIAIFLNGKDRQKLLSHPLLLCAILPLISVYLSMPQFHIRHILVVIAQYVFPLVLYYSIRNKNDISFYIKCLKYLVVCAVVYAFFEEFTRFNPIMQWCSQHQDQFGWMATQVNDASFVRYGVRRVMSFFSGVGAFGAFCIYYWFVLVYMKNQKDKLVGSVLNVMMVALPICALLTGARSTFIALLIEIMAFVSMKTIRNNKILVFSIIVVAILLFPFIMQIIDSIFESDSISGSNLEERNGQWEVAFYYMSQNFWLGNGVGFCSSLLEADEAGLYGAEGMWLPIMMDRGMFGVISVAMCYVITFIYLYRRKFYAGIWLMLSFLVLKTITTVVGVEPTFFLLIIVFLIRYNEINDIRNYGKNNIRNNTCLQG